MTALRNALDLGAALREHRTARGWTQAELARRAGVSRLWLNEVEQGKPRAQVGLVFQVANALGLVLRLEAAPEPPPGIDLNAIIQSGRRP
jgi:HTH-type transcriptional regulator/antitoxin HipB